MIFYTGTFGPAGGYIVEGADPYEVIDDNTGNVVAKFSVESKAVRYALDHGYSPDRIRWNELKALRERNK